LNPTVATTEPQSIGSPFDPVEQTPPKASTAPRQRLEHIDAMRPVKQAGVVSTHTLLAFAPLASLGVGGSLVLLHVCREAFLFVSSCMLTYSVRDLVRSGWRRFYWRRFLSVGLPYLCWTLIYFLLTLRSSGFLLTLRSSGQSGYDALGHLAYLVGTGYYQLYYLIVVLQFYLVFPLLLFLVRRVRRHGLLLALSGVVQVCLVSLMHWGVFPWELHGFWASREITSYQFYLLAGMVVALHLDQVHAWLRSHARLIIVATIVTAALAEGWFALAATGTMRWLGNSSDPFQPIVIPFNVAAIAAIYLVGVYLVGERRGARTRAMVRIGSDYSYSVYLAQMVFITVLTWLGWRQLDHTLSWPVVSVATVVLVYLACVALGVLLARTPFSAALTGRPRQPWETLVARVRRPLRGTTFRRDWKRGDTAQLGDPADGLDSSEVVWPGLSREKEPVGQ
jgi:peptidoglycan/LPS O-acetylase OafA/YrhL